MSFPESGGQPRSVEPSDPVAYQVLQASLNGIVQEMQQSLFRTGYSTIIRESQDASCAVLDAAGRVVGQHVVLPLHIGAFPACAQSVLHRYESDMAPGDAFLINHPYEGGSPHAPDIAVITPFFIDDELVAFAASMAHKSDIGGPVPGSCSASARDIFSEGLHLPAVRIEHRGAELTEVASIVAANSRTPDLVLGDVRGQIGSTRLGARRLVELAEKFGVDTLTGHFTEVLGLSETRLHRCIAAWPDGAAAAARRVDGDGAGGGDGLRVHVEARKQAHTIVFDFSGSSDQASGPANIRPPLLRAACGYCLISLIDPAIEINSGLLDGFDVISRKGSIVNPDFPSPVNTYNPTVHAAIDAVFDALSQIITFSGRGDGCASRSLIIGGDDPRSGKPFVQYEIFGGGSGACAWHDGVSGTTVNQTNGRITPVEIIESEYPMRIRRFELIGDSGGAGRFRGGLGIRREYESLASARLALRSTRHEVPPQGVAGGGAGATGSLVIHPDTPRSKELPARTTEYPLDDGDVFVLDTPGGGGFGDPLDRPPDSVRRDVLKGYVSRKAALGDYGVVLSDSGEGIQVDTRATAQERKRRRAHEARAGQRRGVST
jgi:N-methylhydantoinase B